MLFSRVLLSYCHDVKAYQFVYVMGASGYLTFIFFPDNETLTFLGIIAMLICIGGMDNINLLIYELRVPHENVAAVTLMIRTMAVSSGILSPAVAALPAPIPFVILLAVATVGLVISLKLPPPGQHLNSVERTTDNKVKLLDKVTRVPTMLHSPNTVSEEA